MSNAGEILTVGHSTHSAERFVALLRAHEVELVCDVRRFPASRRNPQFNADALHEALAPAGIGYEPFGEELGGRRRPTRPAEQSPWRVEGFRGFGGFQGAAVTEEPKDEVTRALWRAAQRGGCISPTGPRLTLLPVARDRATPTRVRQPRR